MFRICTPVIFATLLGLHSCAPVGFANPLEREEDQLIMPAGGYLEQPLTPRTPPHVPVIPGPWQQPIPRAKVPPAPIVRIVN